MRGGGANKYKYKEQHALAIVFVFFSRFKDTGLLLALGRYEDLVDCLISLNTLGIMP